MDLCVPGRQAGLFHVGYTSLRPHLYIPQHCVYKARSSSFSMLPAGQLKHAQCLQCPGSWAQGLKNSVICPASLLLAAVENHLAP